MNKTETVLPPYLIGWIHAVYSFSSSKHFSVFCMSICWISLCSAFMVMCSITASKLKNFSVKKVIFGCSIEWVVQKVRKQGTVLLQCGFDRILQSTVLLLQIKKSICKM